MTDLNLRIPQASSDPEISQIYAALRVLQGSIETLYSNRFVSGETNPSSSDYSTGDVFMNTTSGELFKKTTTGWSSLGTLTIT